MESRFTAIYKCSGWGNPDHNPKYSGTSGPGSDPNFNTELIEWLPKWLAENNIKSVCDLGCGSGLIVPKLYKGIDYTGYDCYKEIIDAHNEDMPDFKWQHLDVSRDIKKVKPADMYIFKDVLQHWPNNVITSVLDELIESKQCKKIMIINCCGQHIEWTDIGNIGDFHALSPRMYPLKKYNPVEVMKYKGKSVSIVNIDRT